MINRTRFLRILAPIVLVALAAFLFIINYKSGTWLVGWDNIMPEFNLGLNLKRAVYAVWQEYRGLGLYDGMAHAANLMHTLYIWFLVFFLPLNMLRYAFIFLTYLVGGLGMYAFLRKIFSLRQNQNHATEASLITTAVIGAVMYMVNPAIIQLYFAPLEVFAVHFAALPWILFCLIHTLYSPSHKTYLALFIMSFLFSPQGFVPTIFVICMIAVGMVALGYLLQKSDKERLFSRIKRVVVVVSIILASQAFWLLPYLKGLPQTTKVIQKTRINEFSSETLYQRNKARGDLYNVLTMKGFMLDTLEKDVQNGKNVFFMKAWKDHYDSISVSLVLYVLIGIGFIGMGRILLKRDLFLLPYVGIYTIALVFLASNTPILAYISNLFRTMFPPLGEAFRIPFTKFATLFAYGFSVLFSYGFLTILNKLKKIKWAGFVAIISLFLCLLAYPAFKGQFISSHLKVKLPTDYLQLFSYMNAQPENGRVVLLPANTFWNWEYRNWGQRGSGFLWYGLKQPLLMRAFDPWSLENEQFYNELSHAINAENLPYFESVLRKYNISYMLVDETMINSISDKPVNFSRLENFITTSSLVQKNARFGQLKVFSISSAEPPLTVASKENITSISYQGMYMQHDVIFDEQGKYISTDIEPQTIYPFTGLMTEKLPIDNEFSFVKRDNVIDITTEKLLASSQKTQTYQLTIPSLFSYEHLIPVEISTDNAALTMRLIYPEIIINNNRYLIEGETFSIPLQKVTAPTHVRIADSNQEIGSSGTAYIQNKFNNTIVVKNEQAEETIQFDTRTITAEPFILDISTSGIEGVTARIPMIESPYTHTNLVSDKKYEMKQDIADNAKEPTCGGSSRIILDNSNGKYVDIQATCDSGEITSYVDMMPHQAGYALFIDSQYISGEPLTFYVDNPSEKRPEVETRLSKTALQTIVLLYPTENYFNGYGLHIIGQSQSTDISRSYVTELSAYPIPLETMRHLSFKQEPPPQKTTQIGTGSFSFKKISFFKYVFTSNTDGYLLLDQAYDDGWKAYYVGSDHGIRTWLPFIFGKKILDHERVNGWMNGWSIEKNKHIVVVFMPQYLEFLGFVIAFLTIVIIFLTGRKNTKTHHASTEF